MNGIKIAAMGLALLSSASFAEDCTQPAAPSIPDGAKASMEQMLEGQKSVKTFQSANLEYMACLEKAFTAAKAASEEGSDDAKASAMKAHTKAVDAYNKAVSKEEEVAGQFNTEIREYKAANPG